MGVPGLWGFLARRYPFIVKPLSEGGDAEAPEVDELYIGACRCESARQSNTRLAQPYG